jgi:hypothetical protein
MQEDEMFTIRFSLPILFVGLAVVLSTGVAATADEETASIVGKVAFNGKPIAKGKVAFHPEKGKAIEATIKDGAYSVAKVPVGEMTITVQGKGVPAKYADPKTTPLRYDAMKGTQTLDLELQD